MSLHPTMLNLANLLENSARERPDKPAVIFEEFRFTFRELNAMANQIAHGLQTHGIGRGDKVALCCPNIPYFPLVYYAILKTGAAVVPLNVLFTKREFAYHLADSDAKAFFCFEGTPELPVGQRGYDAFRETPTCKHFWIMTRDPAGQSPFDGVETFSHLMRGHPPIFESAATDPQDTAVILYTSGTTGHPKGAELTHLNLVMNSMVTAQFNETNLNDMVLVVLPLFHSFGQSCLMNTSMLVGATQVLLPRFEAGEVLRLMEEHNITLFAGVPTMYWELLNYPHADKFDLEKIAKNLRLCCSGGAAMPVEVLRKFEEKYKAPILEGYGLSETSPVATFNRIDRPRKVGSIGLPIWGVEVRVVDDDMNDAAIGEPGEVVIRGHNVMKGYYKKPEANQEAFRGGWFHTGDVGKVDEDGYFYIVDRTKDMIIRGGYNVYPRELEEVLMTHPGISLAAVIGVPDEEHGEEIKAFVVLSNGAKNLTERDIIQWAKGELAGYKYPRIVEIRDSLPLGPTGKILKKELRRLELEKRSKV